MEQSELSLKHSLMDLFATLAGVVQYVCWVFSLYAGVAQMVLFPFKDV